MASRNPISKRRRFDIFKRDGFQCQYCGEVPPKAVLHVDHIVPVKEGGGNDEENLITSCASCNLGKGAVPLTKVPQSLSSKAIEAKEREEQLLGYQKILQAQRDRIEAEAWQVADVFMQGWGDDSFRSDWHQSIKRFVKDIGLYECLDAAEKSVCRCGARKNDAFRYFCGICWNIIKEAK